MLWHVVEKGSFFNWTQILSNNLQNEVRKSQESLPRIDPGFFMASYLIDTVCAITHFPLLSLNYANVHEPIHVYYSNLWSINCKNFFYEICGCCMALFYTLLKGWSCPRISKVVIDALKDIAD